MNSHKRLTRIETSLTPLQAVLRWLKETLVLSQEDYLAKMSADPRNPRVIVIKPVGEAVLENLGEPPRELEVVRHAAREAMKRADMLMVLILDLHDHVRSNCASNELYAEMLCDKCMAILETFGRGTFKSDDLKRFEALLEGRLLSMRVLKETVRSISAKYFDGHPLLFAADEERINADLEFLEELAQEYNRLAHNFPAATAIHIDLQGSPVAEHIEALVTILVARAKVKTLKAFGEEDAARKVLDSCVHAGRRELNRLRSLAHSEITLIS